jgi:NAD(P)H dehydrogenase (quinone)
MRHAVILAHPEPTSFNAAIAKAYAEAVAALGDDVELCDLYAEDFDPRLPARELPWNPHFAVAPSVLTQRARLTAAHVVVFVYPLWFNAPPAILKGYVERVLGMGFGYGSDESGGTKPLLAGKSLISVTTSGAPDSWVNQSGARERLRAGFDDYVAAVCGLTVLDHLHLGGVTPGVRQDAAEDMLASVAAMARRHFTPHAQSKSATLQGANS